MAEFNSTKRVAFFESALKELHAFYNSYFEHDEMSQLLRQGLGKEYRMYVALIEANMFQVKIKLADYDYVAACTYLESATNSIGDFVEELCENYCV